MHVDFFIFLVIVNIFLLANCIVTRYQIFLKDKTKQKKVSQGMNLELYGNFLHS